MLAKVKKRVKPLRTWRKKKKKLCALSGLKKRIKPLRTPRARRKKKKKLCALSGLCALFLRQTGLWLKIFCVQNLRGPSAFVPKS
jgi:hypothetical protein